ncbi:HAMP domain-containing sensor histidine kinase [Wukongibacter baidiensis]|uniref:sensor histidine kinase n=1 Tax=Wukongibacter baidiensis TaxID=1723361 RepID=UPI003D7F63AA
MKGVCKVITILNWIVVFLSCIILLMLHFSNASNIYLTAASVLIIAISLVKISLNQKGICSLKRIVEQVERVAAGNLNTRVLVREEGLMADLACNFNKVIERLQQTDENQIVADESRRKLMSNISHDIRTPLTSIIGYVDALKDGVATDEQERMEYIQIISEKSRKLKHLIDEIFQMAKLDSDDITMDFQVHDLAEIVRESIIEFLPELNKQEIELKVDILEEKSLIYCDRLSIDRILNNIIKNAMQYGGKENVIGIELISLENEYQINIWDKGPGIEEEHIPFIFERLYIKDKARKKNLGSSGLGLAIVKKLLEKHGGKIWVQSIPYEKTTFSLTIPKL